MSPLAGYRSLQGPVSLVERAELGALNLRGSGAAFLAAAARTMSMSLPTYANTTEELGELVVLWLGPDEWQLRLPLVEAEPWAEALRVAFDQQHAAVVDVSDRATVLRLRGAPARDVLAQGCPLDLHPRVFRPGACAQSRYLDSAILINQVDEVPTFDLQVPRSHSGYVWQLLMEASREFDR